MPRERLGSADVGEPYGLVESSLGDIGLKLSKPPDRLFVSVVSFDGICRLRLWAWLLSLLGVDGVTVRKESSLEIFDGSRNAGEGDSLGVTPRDDRGRVLNGDVGRAESAPAGAWGLAMVRSFSI